MRLTRQAYRAVEVAFPIHCFPSRLTLVTGYCLVQFITVLVGPAEQPFRIYSNLFYVVTLSFFRHMLRSDRFPESRGKCGQAPRR